MNQAIHIIPIQNLLLTLIPLSVVIFIYFRWSLRGEQIIYASVRMILQLIAIGFVLTFIFKTENVTIIFSILGAMLLMASWISLYAIKAHRKQLYFKALLALSIGGLSVLSLTIFGILDLDPWYKPTYLIPLAGMIFASAMNAVSLAAERFQQEMRRGGSYVIARRVAFRISLLPIVNMFFAVGLVSIPGMMTGQILSGVDPLIAVRYQIMIMAMVLGAAGISSAIYLRLQPERSHDDAKK